MTTRPSVPVVLGWLLYALVLAVVVARHELGHLESQAWNIVRSADSLTTLLNSVGNEGHSPLGYLLIWPLSLFGRPELMQLLGWAVGVLLAWRLIRDRPFAYPLIALLLAGYFLLYEYPAVPRTYLLAVLGLSLLASAIHRQQGSLLYRVSLCCLVAGSSAFGLILSGALMIVVFVVHWVPAQAAGLVQSAHGAWQSARQRPWFESVFPLTLYGVVAAFTVWTIINPSTQSSFEQTLQSGATLKPAKLALTVITPVFPHVSQVPVIGNLWFGTNGVGVSVLLVLALAVLAGVAVLFRRWPFVVLAWVSGSVLIMAVAWYSGFVAERLLGHIVLLAVFLFWVRPALPGYQGAVCKRIDQLAVLAVVCTLLYQAAIGLAVASVDIRKSATGYRSLAARIQSTMNEPYDLVVAESIYHSPLLAYLDREAFDLNCLCVTRFAEWDRLQKRGLFVSMKSNWCSAQSDSRMPTEDRRPILAVLEKAYPFDLSGMTLLSSVPRGFAYPGEPDYNLWLWQEPDCSIDYDVGLSPSSIGISDNIDEHDDQDESSSSRKSVAPRETN